MSKYDVRGQKSKDFRSDENYYSHDEKVAISGPLGASG